MNKMSDAQRRKIFKLAGEKGLDSEMLHGFIKNLTGKDSMKRLSITEAIKVIDGLEGKKQTAAGMITAKQWKFIEGLAKEIGWVDDTGGADEKRLGGWLYSKYGVSALNWLTAKKASDVIEGLKAMKQRLESRKVEAI